MNKNIIEKRTIEDIKGKDGWITQVLKVEKFNKNGERVGLPWRKALGSRRKPIY